MRIFCLSCAVDLVLFKGVRGTQGEYILPCVGVRRVAGAHKLPGPQRLQLKAHTAHDTGVWILERYILNFTLRLSCST